MVEMRRERIRSPAVAGSMRGVGDLLCSASSAAQCGTSCDALKAGFSLTLGREKNAIDSISGLGRLLKLG
jgi:hypothetical protein